MLNTFPSMDSMTTLSGSHLGADTTGERNISPCTTLNGVPSDLSRFAQETSTPLGPNDEEGGDDAEVRVLVVDWDGPDDPKNPKNWSFRRKWAVTAVVSAFSFITPVTSSIVAPASQRLAAELSIRNEVVIALVTSIYVLAYAFGPLFVGPMSEIYGRSRVLQLANLWYLVWNLACGFSSDGSQLLAFRFLAGLGGSAPFAIGGGVLGDCWLAEERGRALSVYSLAPMLGPAVGPIAGAWIAERSTWRWVFWSTSIVDAAIQVLGLIFLQETYAPLLLERKANQIRRSMDAEKFPHRQVRTIFEGKGDRSWRAIMRKALVRPFAFFTREPIIQLLGLYMAFLYGIMYLFVTSIPSIFVGVYGQSPGIAGLHYLALGLGMSCGSQTNARMLDRVYRYLKSQNGGVGRPEFRLPGMFVGTVLLPIGLLLTGWSVHAHTHWIVPDIGMLVVGAGIMFNWQCINAYIVDAFTLYAASALAAVTFLRSLAGCGFPLFAPAMYAALGFGTGDTVLAAIAVVIGCPAPWIFWHFGERIRNASRHAR